MRSKQPPRKKRGTTRPESYKRYIIRDARVKGAGYVSYKAQEQRGKVVVKPFIDGMISSTFTFLKCDKPPELPNQPAYPQGKVPINKKKIQDLRKLTEYTRGYEHFYNAILLWPTTDSENPEEVDQGCE
ncbi:uncharacterized protein LOC124361209 [Homalodisca vitripennis]|uniref:uncharacterized protein LOC124361209 n=1 Tax=Homalodisca vitripennis TaxID=197043 RepID=UPI001EEC7813|nr:uncharacterized protein LOC124361209 [Homalodisca vitripennis]